MDITTSKPARVIIAGSRHYKCYNQLKEAVDKVLSRLLLDPTQVEIFGDGDDGPGLLAQIYARDKGLKFRPFNIRDYKMQHGKAADFARNLAMVQNATHCILFWDGLSRCTGHIREVAMFKRLKLCVFRVPGPDEPDSIKRYQIREPAAA